MKIIYCTDIHDALKELRILLRQTEADLYLLSGDILYKAFYDEEKIYQFASLQEEFYALAKKLGEKIFPFDLAQNILRFPEKYNQNNGLRHKAAELRRLFEKATKTMREKYELIEELVVKYSNAECRMLPGNYDIDFRYTALEHRSIHHRTIKFNDFLIAGYGGAPIATSGIPEKLAVVFHETNNKGHLYSEPENFFNETEPDIIMIHNPAYGFFDRIPTLGHVGSLGIRNYLDRHAPKLVLSGHVHEDYGIAAKKNGTVLMNPSNFGGVDSAVGWQYGGSFAEIFMESGQVHRVNLNLLLDDKIHRLLEIKHFDNLLEKKIFNDAKNYSHLDIPSFVRDSMGSIIHPN